jgi:hypothetical protein
MRLAGAGRVTLMPRSSVTVWAVDAADVCITSPAGGRKSGPAAKAWPAIVDTSAQSQARDALVQQIIF